MTDEVFKIKTNRREDTIQILEQPDDLPHGLIGRYCGLEVRQACFPEYRKSSGVLYLRDSNISRDQLPVMCQGNQETIVKAIKELCIDRMYKFVKVGDGFMGEIE